MQSECHSQFTSGVTPFAYVPFKGCNSSFTANRIAQDGVFFGLNHGLYCPTTKLCKLKIELTVFTEFIVEEAISTYRFSPSS